MAEIRWINKNKCCIEILCCHFCGIPGYSINKNKCCIEILDVYGFAKLLQLINKNKCCIEIISRSNLLKPAA